MYGEDPTNFPWITLMKLCSGRCKIYGRSKSVLSMKSIDIMWLVSDLGIPMGTTCAGKSDTGMKCSRKFSTTDLTTRKVQVALIDWGLNSKPATPATLAHHSSHRKSTARFHTLSLCIQWKAKSLLSCPNSVAVLLSRLRMTLSLSPLNRSEVFPKRSSFP